MAVTHFEITQLPDPAYVTSTISGNPLLVNVKYPIASQSNVLFTKTAVVLNNAFSIYFKWKGHDVPENISSVETRSTIRFRRSDLPDPIPLDKDMFMLNDETLNLLAILPLNENVEYIQIETLTGYNGFRRGTSPVSEGDILKIQELNQINFTSLSEGGGLPYSTMTYSIGKEQAYYGIATLNLLIDYLAKINEVPPRQEYLSPDIFDVLGTDTEYDVQKEIIRVEITEGAAYGIANVELIINSDFLSLNDFNQIFINNGSEQIIFDENDTDNIDVILNQNGRGFFEITNYIVNDTAVPKVGEITVNLIDVNSDAGTVDPAINQIILTTNY